MRGVFWSCGLQLPASPAMLRGCLEQWIWGPARPLNPGRSPRGLGDSLTNHSEHPMGFLQEEVQGCLIWGGEKTEKGCWKLGLDLWDICLGGEKSVAQPCLFLKRRNQRKVPILCCSSHPTSQGCCFETPASSKNPSAEAQQLRERRLAQMYARSRK